MSFIPQHAFVYHRYNMREERQVWKDTHSPILASIATLRAVNQEATIYVLDTEPFLEDWGEFPHLLRFHVIQQPPQIPVPYNGGWPFQSRIVSRIWDVWNLAQTIPEPVVVYSDCDLFWRKNPIPLAHDPVEGFCGDLRGSGFFYFRTRCLPTELFVNTWRSLVLGGILSNEIRLKMRISNYHLSLYMDEMPYCYMVRHGMHVGWKEIPPLEHYFLNHLTDPVDPEAKNYHAHSGHFGSDRLRVARRVHDFSNAIRSVLDEHHVRLLLDGVEPDTPFERIADLAPKTGE